YKSLRYRDLRVAKGDRIPVCTSFVESCFQCLHFDYGLPILPGPDQALYAVTALFMSPTSTSSGTATRLLPLNALRGTAWSGAWNARRVKDYAREHGDGWRQPTAENTGRLSIFLRFLDAMSSKPRFSQFIDTDSATFVRDCAPSGESTAEQLWCERELL